MTPDDIATISAINAILGDTYDRMRRRDQRRIVIAYAGFLLSVLSVMLAPILPGIVHRL